MASNPVFDRIEKESRQGYAGFGRGGAPTQQPMAGRAATDGMSSQQLQDLYNQPAAGPVQTKRLTIDDVVMKTLGLFAIVLIFGAVAWQLAADLRHRDLVCRRHGRRSWCWASSIAFKKTISVPLIVAYAVFEGVFVGAISEFYSTTSTAGTDSPIFQGIVAQAVLATLSVFAGMLLAYKTGIIKVTEKFRRIVTMAVIGYAIFALINLVYALVTGNAFGIGGIGTAGHRHLALRHRPGLGDAGPRLRLDRPGHRRGRPEKYSWLLAHGLIVTLVWLYLEILRLLGRLRSD